MKIWIRPCLSIVIITLALTAPMLVVTARSLAQDDIDLEKYAKVKAAFVLNFVRYVTWPATSFVDEQPLKITVVGRDAFQDELESLLRSEQVNGRKIQLQRIRHPQETAGRSDVDDDALRAFYDELRSSHVLFIAKTEHLRYGEMLQSVEGVDILTVSDIGGFAQNGGMIELAVREGRVAFDANPTELGDTKLQASSKLLRLAQIVTTRGREQ